MEEGRRRRKERDGEGKGKRWRKEGVGETQEMEKGMKKGMR
jgi:hypothetical protein